MTWRPNISLITTDSERVALHRLSGFWVAARELLAHWGTTFTNYLASTVCRSSNASNSSPNTADGRAALRRRPFSQDCRSVSRRVPDGRVGPNGSDFAVRRNSRWEPAQRVDHLNTLRRRQQMLTPNRSTVAGPGYVEVERRSLADVEPSAVPFLVAPCEVAVLRKPLVSRLTSLILRIGRVPL